MAIIGIYIRFLECIWANYSQQTAEVGPQMEI